MRALSPALDGRRDRLAALALLAFAGVLGAPLWTRLGRIPEPRADPDHFQQLSFCRAFHDAVRQGELPLWTPWFGGGFPFAGSPDQPGLSPAGLLCAALPELPALKLLALVALLLGSYGMLRVGREWLRLSLPGALLAALLYTGSPWFAGRLASGNYFELPLFALPFAILCLGRLLERRWLGLLLPALFATFLHAKYGGLVAPAAVLVFALACARDFGTSRHAVALAWLAAVACGAALALHRILPMLDVLARDLAVHRSLVAPRGYQGFADLLAYLVEGGRDANLWVGLGWPAVLAAAAGALLAPRRGLNLVALFAAAALFGMGPRSPLPLWELTAHVPGLEAMQPGKYVSGILPFSSALLAGLALDRLLAWLEARAGLAARTPAWWGALAGAFLALASTPLATSFAVSRDLFTSDDFEVSPEPFHQVASTALLGGRARYRGASLEPRETNQYYNLRRNVGTLTWYGGMILPERATPRFAIDPDGQRLPVAGYRGEVRCLETNADCEVGGLEVGYNEIRFRAASGAGARAVLNFNAEAGFRAQPGRVVEHEGLLAVELPPGTDGPVVLRYASPAFRLGLAAGAGALAGWLALAGGFIARGRGSSERDARASGRRSGL